MALFGFGKKKEAVQKPVCTCQCSCCPPEQDATSLPQTHGCSPSECTIKVLGTGCTSCHTLLENTQEAVRHLGLPAQVEYVQDMAQIASYGVMSVPALVVNDQVVSCGKVLKPAEVEGFLQTSGC